MYADYIVDLVVIIKYLRLQEEVALTKKEPKILFLRNVMAAVQIERQNTVANALLGPARKARGYYIVDFVQIIRVSR